MTDECYAHSKKGLPPGQWHRLEDHLRGTGSRAQELASKFGCGKLGWYAGLWHDLGKYAADWQEFIHVAGEDASSLGEETPEPRPVKRRRGPDHSTAGAIHAREVIGHRLLAKILSFVIASHHGGLPNEGDLLERRLIDEQKRERYALTLRSAQESIVRGHDLPSFPAFFRGEGTLQEQKRQYEMLIRMLFSALVDADYLDTEHFMELDGERSAHRGVWPALSDYESPLLDFLETIERESTAALHLRQARSDVLRWCREAASGERGVFTLTVPTGGGKTLSSLAFALRHARVHGLERVIIALPFLSILDQTASILRGIFERHLGVDVLVEHHSNITPERDTARNRLATENWDAPLIVTTQVQLFESLFARRTSDCRKLHNLANSVIVLDEVQTLPVGLLDPILDVLQQLRDYGTTIILTTATQPAFHSRMLGPMPFRGLSPQPREIVPPDAVDRLFDLLRRVDVTWPGSAVPVAWPDLADAVASERQVLVIVHRRADAAELWRAVNERSAEAFHLSALMCPAHRRKILTSIRDRLTGKQECRVISTQLVEAGVDVDFPVVYRAMAGLESLAQSAGRCNREGKLDSGSFRVFRAPTQPVGPLKHHKEIAETMLAFDPELDLFAPQTFRGYFDRLYAERPRDVKNVQVARQSLQFEETADRFRMIDEATTTVFVPYDDSAEKAIAALRAAGPSRERFRALQPYGVAVYPDALETLKRRGAVELLHDAVWILASDADYDKEHLGLLVDREGFEAHIV